MARTISGGGFLTNVLKDNTRGGGATAAGNFSPERIRDWLASLAAADTLSTAGAMIERLVEVNKTPLGAALRLEVLDLFREQVEWLLPQLESRIGRAQLPLAEALRQVVYSIEKLLKELGYGYAQVVASTPRVWLGGGRKRLHAPLTRALDFAARRLVLSQRMYTRSPAGVWGQMHELYRLACDWGVAERPINSPYTTPLNVYRDALLIAFAEPTKLVHGDVMRIQAYLTSHGSLAQLVSNMKVDAAPCVFAIDPGRDHAGVAYAKREDAGLESCTLMLFTHQLVERLENEWQQLTDGVAPTTLGLPPEAGEPHYRKLLQRLIGHWRGERKPRPTRTECHPHADVWVGLREVWRLLRHGPPKGSAAAAAPARRGVPAPGSTWVVLNEGERGFALRYISGALPTIGVGELLALRARERNAVSVCLVRWVQSNNPEHLEVGLQQLGPTVVTGMYKTSTAPQSTSEPMLLLPNMPARNRATVVTAAPNRLRGDQPFSLRHRHGHMLLCAARVIETTPSVAVVEVVAPPRPTKVRVN